MEAKAVESRDRSDRRRVPNTSTLLPLDTRAEVYLVRKRKLRDRCFRLFDGQWGGVGQL